MRRWHIPAVFLLLLGICSFCGSQGARAAEETAEEQKAGTGKEARKIALTFDDGPHPVYTPQMLELLKKYQVHATFFVLVLPFLCWDSRRMSIRSW